MANPTVFKKAVGFVAIWRLFLLLLLFLLFLLVLQLYMMLLHNIKLRLFFDRHFLELYIVDFFKMSSIFVANGDRNRKRLFGKSLESSFYKRAIMEISSHR